MNLKIIDLPLSEHRLHDIVLVSVKFLLSVNHTRLYDLLCADCMLVQK